MPSNLKDVVSPYTTVKPPRVAMNSYNRPPEAGSLADLMRRYNPQQSSGRVKTPDSLEDVVSQPEIVQPPQVMRNSHSMDKLHPWLGRLHGRMGVGSFVPVLNEGLNLMDRQEGEAEGLGRMVTDKLSPYVPAQVAGGAGALAYTAASMFDPVPGPSPAMVFHHGSPHKFAKFNMDKIGTGEGHQAFGHGLYFAENPNVAGQYKDALSGKIMDIPGVDGNVQRQLGRDFWGSDFDSVDDIPADWWEYQAKTLEESGEYAGAKQLRAADKSKAKILDGSLYEVDIPDEAIAKMLDWDAPLKDQPEAVRSVLEGLDLTDDIGMYLRGDHLDKRYASSRKPLDEITGKELIQRLANAFGGERSGSLSSPKMASDFLRDRGIPGIKYLDGGSRTAGKGTRNVVVFDDSIIEMLSRNGEELAP